MNSSVASASGLTVDSILNSGLDALLGNGTPLSSVAGEFSNTTGLDGSSMMVDDAGLSVATGGSMLPFAAEKAGQDGQLLGDNLHQLRAEMSARLREFAQARSKNEEVAIQNTLRSIELIKQSMKSLREYQEMLNEVNPRRRVNEDMSLPRGFAFSRKDLPKFQLATSLVRPFPNEEAFESVEHFLRTFEKVIESSGRQIELVWRTFFPLCLPNSEDAWYETNMRNTHSWVEARKVFKNGHSSKNAVR
ncbi:uncharacterized protein BX663DRAFT_554484 [Cokeromyces recurvatus]|uniref:uncharacterized protein n=1 Tax=Cokeromyces recurvatus TaxID=90255 RepID=UPI00221EAF5F|nr:uncharacterized protein BX663DRAFT_554484 [Cokeromyces recurvatus]KAI7900039.1 hypothetical protein BX663DRAFT_554484 [Cokeromyces recurvatus]